MLFGEILLGMKLTLEAADRLRGQGDPFGPVTLRTLEAARREFDAYDRSREMLMELTRTELRTRLHTLMVRLRLGLDGVMEISGMIAKASADDLASRAFLDQGRARSYAYLQELSDRIPAMITRLEQVSGQEVSGMMRDLRAELELDLSAPAGG